MNYLCLIIATLTGFFLLNYDCFKTGLIPNLSLGSTLDIKGLLIILFNSLKILYQILNFHEIIYFYISLG